MHVFLLPLALNGWSERWGREVLEIFSVLVLLFGEEGACKFTANLQVNSEGCMEGCKIGSNRLECQRDKVGFHNRQRTSRQHNPLYFLVLAGIPRSRMAPILI